MNEVYSLELNDDEAEPTSLDLMAYTRLGRIVFAQIIHRVVEDGDDPYKTKYVIRTSEGDMNEIEVSALDCTSS